METMQKVNLNGVAPDARVISYAISGFVRF